jgi:hypothetical protein
MKVDTVARLRYLTTRARYAISEVTDMEEAVA